MATLHTIGHSTRELDAFIELLRAHRIERLVDVRRYPGSRRYPHFGSESLRLSLRDAGIAYRHAPELGGRRSSKAPSVNTWWRSASFRAYADYMGTDEFRRARDELIAEAAHERTTVMCAEAVPWRCHRNLISDAVVAAGHAVVHIIDAGAAEPHVLNPAARVDAEGGVTYPAPEGEQGRLPL